MINLPNGCTCSNLSVYPKNWKSKNAKLSVDWYIIYRFYDPKYSNPKQVMVKGMNHFKSLVERQTATKKAMAEEIDKLMNECYNPFQKPQLIINEKEIGDVTLHTPILEALRTVSKKLSVSDPTKRDIKFMLSLIEKAVKFLGFQTLPISNVGKKILKMILETASNSADRFNKNRSYLMILFSELCELEVVNSNPLRDIKKKKVVKHIRQVLTNEERVLVNDHLEKNYPEFHRFLHIFFHSGARISELLRVNETDIDISNQRFKLIIKKGREYKEVWKTIKDIALPYWNSIMEECKKGEYLFSKGLKPGIRQIQPYQIGKRWNRLVKQNLHIEADFYALKHLHTTEIVDILNAKEAAKHNSHTTTAMVIGIYDVKKGERQHNAIKELNNKFA